MSEPIYLFDHIDHWAMAGTGRFKVVRQGLLESEGGPGVFWYTERTFGDFWLTVDWRLSHVTDNSGIFLRFPALGSGDPVNDWRPAAEEGLEVQIDDRGYDPATHALDSPPHLTGAICKRAPATARASRPVGEWNAFEIVAQGPVIDVALNGVRVARLEGEASGTPLSGHIGLQAHHPDSRVQFRHLVVKEI